MGYSMKRSTIQRKHFIKKQSERGRSYQDELDELRPALAARSGGRCEGQLARCIGGPGQPHHKLRRSQGGKNTMANLIMCCPPCHEWIHAHPSEAYELGLLTRSGR